MHLIPSKLIPQLNLVLLQQGPELEHNLREAFLGPDWEITSEFASLAQEVTEAFPSFFNQSSTSRKRLWGVFAHEGKSVEGFIVSEEVIGLQSRSMKLVAHCFHDDLESAFRHFKSTSNLHLFGAFKSYCEEHLEIKLVLK